MPTLNSRLLLLVLFHWLLVCALTVDVVAADGWVVGTGGTAVKSTDGGANWNGTGCPGPSCPPGADLNSVFFIDARLGWAAGLGSTIIKTTTGGTSWNATNCPGPTCIAGASLRSVHFVNSTTGWTAGTGATILKTTTGGTTWDRTPCPGPSCPTGADLNSVFFIDSNTGWAAGLGAAIIKSTTGGTSWSTTNCPGPTCTTTASLKAVHFVNGTTGWAAGTGATILKTTTGGTTWVATQCPGPSCPTGVDLNSVFFIDSSTGWAVGLGATIIKTTTGGTSWIKTNCPGASCPTSASMNSVFFLDSQAGWAVGSGATILSTTDGGTTWVSTACPGPSCPTGSSFQSVRFVNCADGDGDGYYAPVNCGTVLDCNDGNASIHPGATETCNSVDDNCSGSIDEGVTTTYYRDADGDGFGSPGTTTQACSRPAGYVTNNTDCDDASSQDHPGATEIVANGDDENCDGQELCYRDNDGDGFGTLTTIPSSDLDCIDAGESTVSTDCDDASSQDHPGATEIVANNDDENCDGQELCYRDDDGDGLGTSITISSSDLDCADLGESSLNTDCDDSLTSCLTDCADYNGNAFADCAEVPQPPANLRVVSPAASASRGTLGLSWDPWRFAAGYKIAYGRSAGIPERELTVSNVTNTTVEGLSDCTTWYFTVRAINGFGESSASNEISSWPQPYIESLDLVSIRQGETKAVTIQGANFPPNSTVAIPESSVVVDGVLVVSCNRIDAAFMAPPSAGEPRPALVGTHEMWVHTPDGLVGQRPSALTVKIDPFRFDLNRSDPSTVDRIDGKDLVWLARQFATNYSLPLYDWAYDFDGDGWVDGVDLAFLAANLGRCWAGTTWTIAACP